MKQPKPPYADLRREINRLSKLVSRNVDAYATHIYAERTKRKQDRDYVQRRAQAAVRFLEMGHLALARETLRPLMQGDYNEQKTTGTTTSHASTTGDHTA